jgi:hypothetical protein
MKYFNLNNEKINPGFKVPEGYFEAFETIINALSIDIECDISD